MAAKQMIWATSYNINPDFPSDRQWDIRERSLSDFKEKSKENSVGGVEVEPEVQVEWWAAVPEELKDILEFKRGRFLMGVIVGRIELSEDAPEAWDEFVVDADEVESKIQALLSETLAIRAIPDTSTMWILKPDFLSGME